MIATCQLHLHLIEPRGCSAINPAYFCELIDRNTTTLDSYYIIFNGINRKKWNEVGKGHFLHAGETSINLVHHFASLLNSILTMVLSRVALGSLELNCGLQ